MKIHFFKYDGAGNDFVILDCRNGYPSLTTGQIEHICHRRFGIGADGMMTLGPSQHPFLFEMRYYNSDGKLGSMCGNGGRCIVAFAKQLGLGDGRHYDFVGFDGPHKAEVLSWNNDRGVVRLGMRDIAAETVRECHEGWFLDTGSPHYVQRVVDIDNFDVEGEGRRLRYRTDLFPEGANIDFIEDMPDGRLKVRTYERGVEAETWACGTGVTACAIVSGKHSLVTRGGDFNVDFESTGSEYKNVFLIGPVSFNFEGNIEI